MSPHYIGDPAEPKVVPAPRWYAKPAAAQPAGASPVDMLQR
jgi:hypothetical protein